MVINALSTRVVVVSTLRRVFALVSDRLSFSPWWACLGLMAFALAAKDGVLLVSGDVISPSLYVTSALAAFALGVYGACMARLSGRGLADQRWQNLVKFGILFCLGQVLVHLYLFSRLAAASSMAAAVLALVAAVMTGRKASDATRASAGPAQ